MNYVGGRLPPRRARRLVAHVDLCLTCGQLVEALRAFWPTGRRVGKGAPRRVGPYRIEELLRDEAHGPVFAARDPDTEREVAIKLVQGPGARHLDPDAIRALGSQLAEIPGGRALPIVDAGRIGDDVFIAMPRIRGITFTELLEDEGEGWRETAGLFADVARVLSGAHERGAVHGHLGLDNMLVDANGAAHIADFGLGTYATLTDGAAPRCVAPEQHGGIQTAGGDQFSFGVALYEALYSCPPYTGDTSGELLMATVSGGLNEPEQRSGGKGLWDLVVRCLATDPRERWPDMATVADQLEHHSRSRLAWLGRLFGARPQPDCRAA